MADLLINFIYFQDIQNKHHSVLICSTANEKSASALPEQQGFIKNSLTSKWSQYSKMATTHTKLWNHHHESQGNYLTVFPSTVRQWELRAWIFCKTLNERQYAQRRWAIWMGQVWKRGIHNRPKAIAQSLSQIANSPSRFWFHKVCSNRVSRQWELAFWKHQCVEW